MKKQLVSLAVAAALVSPLAAQAGTQIYGKLHVSIDDRLDDSDATDGWDVVSRASRLGFKGSEDLGNGLKAIWKLEFQIAMADSDGSVGGEGGNTLVKARNMYVGFAGGWGTFLYGRHDTPFKISTGRLDKFVDTLADYNGSLGPGFQDIRADNAIAYISPSFAGLTIAAAIVPAGNTTLARNTTTVIDTSGNPVTIDQGPQGNPDSDGLADTYSIALMYSNGPLYLAAAYETLDQELLSATATDSADKWRIGAGFTLGAFDIGAIYEDQQDVATIWQIQASFAMGNNVIKAAYGQNDSDIIDNTDNSYAIGVDHNFSKRTKAYLLYAATDNDVDNTDQSGFSFGIVHKF